MKYKGRWVTFLSVLIINSTYILYYYIRDGQIPVIELIGLPFILALAWWFGGQYDQVRYIAEKDVLTETYNRRFILQVFPKLITLANRKQEHLCLALLDVNGFKEINDTYGHEAGDRVLQEISRALISSTRNRDIVARWGGDEFLIISPDIDQKGAQIMIKRIESGLAESSKGLDIAITVSIGMAIYPMEAQTLDQLLRVADKQMYGCKSRGGKRRRS